MGSESSAASAVTVVNDDSPAVVLNDVSVNRKITENDAGSASSKMVNAVVLNDSKVIGKVTNKDVGSASSKTSRPVVVNDSDKRKMTNDHDEGTGQPSAKKVKYLNGNKRQGFLLLYHHYWRYERGFQKLATQRPPTSVSYFHGLWLFVRYTCEVTKLTLEQLVARHRVNNQNSENVSGNYGTKLQRALKEASHMQKKSVTKELVVELRKDAAKLLREYGSDYRDQAGQNEWEYFKQFCEMHADILNVSFDNTYGKMLRLFCSLVLTAASDGIFVSALADTVEHIKTKNGLVAYLAEYKKNLCIYSLSKIKNKKTLKDAERELAVELLEDMEIESRHRQGMSPPNRPQRNPKTNIYIRTTFLDQQRPDVIPAPEDVIRVPFDVNLEAEDFEPLRDLPNETDDVRVFPDCDGRPQEYVRTSDEQVALFHLGQVPNPEGLLVENSSDELVDAIEQRLPLSDEEGNHVPSISVRRRNPVRSQTTPGTKRRGTPELSDEYEFENDDSEDNISEDEDSEDDDSEDDDSEDDDNTRQDSTYDPTADTGPIVTMLSLQKIDECAKNKNKIARSKKAFKSVLHKQLRRTAVNRNRKKGTSTTKNSDESAKVVSTVNIENVPFFKHRTNRATVPFKGKMVFERRATPPAQNGTGHEFMFDPDDVLQLVVLDTGEESCYVFISNG